MPQYHFPAGVLPEEKVVAHGDDYPSWKRVVPEGKQIPGFTQVATSRTSPGANSRVTDPGHLHKTMYEVYFVHAGRAHFWVGNEEFEVGPGDVVIVPPMTVHNHEVLGEEDFVLFYFGVATGPK